jgi:hypothetical protein
MNYLSNYKIGDILKIEDRFIGLVIRADSDYFDNGVGEFIFDGKMILLISDNFRIHVDKRPLVLEIAIGYYEYFEQGHVELLGNIGDTQVK